MTDRREFEMTQADLDGIMAKIGEARNTPMIALQCGSPPSVQEASNVAWAELGARMGFDPMTVQRGQSDLKFFAVPVAQSAVLANVPRLDSDLSWDAETRVGFDLFALGEPVEKAMSVREDRGWWLAWARCYGQGVKSAMEGREGYGTDCPHPTGSLAAEAWNKGYDETNGL